jgi:hypothetical protein
VAPRLWSAREPVEPKPLTAIDDVLEKPLEQPMEFNETPLRDVIAGFRKVAGIDVLIDRRGLEDAGLDLDTPITARLPAGLPLATALDVAIREADLTWMVRDDLLEITTSERAQERLFVHVHDVADLADTAGGLQLLIDLIQSAVAADTWDTVGGPGSIRPVDGDVPCLVVRHSTAGHRQVHGFLESLPPSRQPGAFFPTLEAKPRERGGGMGGGNPFLGPSP